MSCSRAPNSTYLGSPSVKLGGDLPLHLFSSYSLNVQEILYVSFKIINSKIYFLKGGNHKRTLGLLEIAWRQHQTVSLPHRYHLWQRKATLLLLQKTQMTIPSASFAWNNPKMLQSYMVTQDTAVVAMPVRKCSNKGGTLAQFAGPLLIMWSGSLMLEVKYHARSAEE